MPDDPEDVAIATNMIGLARSLRLDALVDGVETREQLAFVRDQRCALAQGYYFSPPVSADDFAMLLREERSAPLPRDAFVPVGT